MTPFIWPVRVYYGDTDAAGVVYNANYLDFLERARTEWLRMKGYSQQALVAQLGVLFVVSEAQVKFRKPARLDDELLVSCEPEVAGRVAIDFRQRIWRGGVEGELVAEASVRVVCVDAGSFRPCRPPGTLFGEQG